MACRRSRFVKVVVTAARAGVEPSSRGQCSHRQRRQVAEHSREVKLVVASCLLIASVCLAVTLPEFFGKSIFHPLTYRGWTT